MAAAPYPSLAARASTRVEEFAARVLGEFAPRPHRTRAALRASAIGAIGAALMAAAHIDSTLGPYVVWMLAGTPAAMISWRKGVVFLFAEALLITASVMLARVLAQSPPLMLLFLGGFGFATTYLINRYRLGSFGIITQVLMIDNLYGVMFAPDALGWRAAYGFAAIATAIGLLALFDNLLWPDPAEGVLLETLAANLLSIRMRVLESTRYFLDPLRKSPPRVANWRELNARMALLARARAEGVSEHRRSILLALITRVARLESESDVLALIAAEGAVAPAARKRCGGEIETVVRAITDALGDLAAAPAAMMRSGPDEPPEPSAARAQAAFAFLDEAIRNGRQEIISLTNAVEFSNLSAFLSSLRAIVELIERPLDEPTATSPGRIAEGDDGGRGLKQYSMKVAVALIAAYIIGLTTQRPDLSTIMTTVLITGLPTFGAVRRKVNLRILGSIIGGIVTIGAIIVTAPNFETVPSYMMVAFAVFFISSYAGQCSENISYAGKQIGTTFALVFVGLSPALDISEPLWRTWGIILGSIVVAVVFLLLWPEYSGKSLLPRLRLALEMVAGLDPRTPLDEITLRQRDAALATLLEQMLSVAEDAQLEGRASGLNPDALIGAAGSLRRIAHRFERIQVMRLRQPRPSLDAASEELETAAIAALIDQLAAWQADYARPDCLQRAPDGVLLESYATEATSRLVQFNKRIEAEGFAAIADWRLEERRTLLAELQSLRRLGFLMGQLNEQLSAIRLHQPK